MWSHYIWSLTLITLAQSNPRKIKEASTYRALKVEGDFCELENGQAKVCRKFSNCPSAQRDFDTDRFTLTRCNAAASPLCCDELTISQKKCREYSKWIDSPVLSLENKKIPGTCGITIEPTIVGGTAAGELEFPHMAHLGLKINSEIQYGCGASLISEQYLLTAAHCLSYEGIPVSMAKLGRGDHRSRKTYKIAKTFPHPQYDPSTYYNDIALVQLEKPLPQFTDYLRPACLQTEKDKINITANHAFASGWGLTTWKGRGSDILLKVSLPLLNNADCVKFYPTNKETIPRGLDENTMICAGGKNINKDACQGDSGGPLQIVKKNSSCMYTVIAVTAFGRECGSYPGIYTKVAPYISWIESIVWPDKK